VGAAVNLLAGGYTVTDDPALAVGTGRSHVMDGALEAVIGVALSIAHHFESMRVFIAADLAHCHLETLHFCVEIACLNVRMVSPASPGTLRECSYE
jgi:hypothetical protein